MIERLRFWLGAKLLQPHAQRLIWHYRQVAHRYPERVERTDYIQIGVLHAMDWRYRPEPIEDLD